jgi:HK97 family phage prohead protease
MTPHPISMTAKDAEMVEQYKLTKIDICSIYRVPPHKVMDLDRATFSNIEQQSISYVVDTIRPWAVRWEQAINSQLLNGSSKYYAEHLVDGLLRGDIASRYGAYSIGRQWGWLNADDIRGLENMNPLPDGKGQVYLEPLNMVEAGTDRLQLSKDNAAVDAPITDEEKEQAARTIRQLRLIRDPKLAEQVTAWQADHKRKSTGIDRRYADLELRMDFDSKNPRIIGYAAVFNKRAEIWPGFFEKVAPGAFANAIKKDDVRALLNHDPNYVLGRNTAETLFLSEDEKGLRYEIIPPDTSWAKDLQISIKRKDINQSSFGFNIVDEDIQHDKNSVTRTIKDVRLFDVSPVTYPAYPSTEVHVRMIAGEQEVAYLFEDSGKVIVQSNEVAPLISDVSPMSDEELFRLCDVAYNKALRK